MRKFCTFCKQPVEVDEITTYKQVTGWVHGPKRDSMTMREETGEVAHEHCIKKIKEGQAVDQPSLFEEKPLMYQLGNGHNPNCSPFCQGDHAPGRN